MNPDAVEIQMTVDDVLEDIRQIHIDEMVLTQDPVSQCSSETLSCPCWADCEIAGRCLGTVHE